MSFDISTLLNVLGLVLTVLFFVVGYRQTIGARKERARAANKRIIDTLFRRLTHEENFSLSSSTVEKLLGGWALDARIRSSDMLGPDEVEAILIARVLENDYISAEQRQAIVTRIRSMFKVEALAALTPDVEALASRKRLEGWFLALGSGVAALATSLATAALLVDNPSALLRDSNVENVGVTLTLVVALTAAATAIYSYLRDASRSVRIESVGGESHPRFEQAFYRVARRHIPSLAPAENRSLDFIFSKDGASFGIEVKEDANRLGKMRYNQLRKRLQDTAERLNLEKIYLVSARHPADHQDDGNDRIVALSARDFVAEFAPQGPTVEPPD